MAVSSTMLALGTFAPDFSLPDVTTGHTVSLSDFAEYKALLVVFLCAHCPYVVHVQPELSRIAKEYADRGVAVIGITSNDIEQYPQDAPEPTAQMAREAHLNFPILYDASQSVAKTYTAACTPDFFLFGPDRKLVYRGQLDDSRPGRGSERPERGTPDGRDLRAALGTVIADNPVDPNQMPSIGCNIKWKPGNEPVYFGG